MKRHHVALAALIVGCSLVGSSPGEVAENFRLLHRLSLADLGLNPNEGHVYSVVGWADAASHREFALVASFDSTTFLEVTNPAAPRLLGQAADTHYAFAKAVVVNDRLYVPDLPAQRVAHFDLRQLLTVSGPPRVFQPTILAAPPTGVSGIAGHDRLFVARSGALQAYDVSAPAAPRLAGELTLANANRHTSAIYHGPDADYQGHELVFAMRPSPPGAKLAIADFHDIQQPELIAESARNAPPGVPRGIVLTSDQAYTLSADAFGGGLFVADIRDLDAPTFVGRAAGDGWLGPIDDLQVRGSYACVPSSDSGLSVIDVRQAVSGASVLDDLGLYDVDDEATHGVYPHLPSGHVLVAQSGSLAILSPFRAPADGNWDGHITGADFTIWSDSFGQFDGDAQSSDGDYTGDGFVTGADFTVWSDYFGRGSLDDLPQSAAAVPEPSCLALAGIGLAAALAISRRPARSRARRRGRELRSSA